MRAIRRSLQHALTAAALVAAGAGAARVAPAGPLHGGCATAPCVLRPPTADEQHAILAEADRLLAQYAADTSTLGRRCLALGAAMRDDIADVRMLPAMWRAVDPEGDLAAVTGDAHLVEPAAGAGRVHIARGFDALNPDRGLAAVVETARHEFAHLNGMGRREQWGLDEGAQLAAACAPADE